MTSFTITSEAEFQAALDIMFGFPEERMDLRAGAEYDLTDAGDFEDTEEYNLNDFDEPEYNLDFDEQLQAMQDVMCGRKMDAQYIEDMDGYYDAIYSRPVPY